MKNAHLFLLTISFLFISKNVNAFSDSLSHETNSTIAELSDFHEVIHPIWHEAYPEKDIKSLKEFLPPINEGAEKIYAVALPGILRDKESKWKEGVEAFKKSVENYNDAAEGTDDQALLNAAEELHAKYEMLVKIIRPVLKEIDEFHKLLYIIYHKYLPEKDYNKIKEMTPDLKTKAEAIKTVKLPKRLEKKSDEITTAVNELISAVESLDHKCHSAGWYDIDEAVEFMHSKYVALEGLFE